MQSALVKLTIMNDGWTNKNLVSVVVTYYIIAFNHPLLYVRKMFACGSISITNLFPCPFSLEVIPRRHVFKTCIFRMRLLLEFSTWYRMFGKYKLYV